MHDTALEIGRKFFEVYLSDQRPSILEVGSIDVNGTLRDCAPPDCRYTGIDIVAGRGVDIVLGNPHSLPFDDNGFDATISSSCFEHAQMFWLTFLEMVRVTKPAGYIYLNTPSNGWYHSYPFDYWRFYPDAGLALAAWAAHQGKEVSLVESFIARRKADAWNDCVIVFCNGPIERCTLPKKLLADVVPDSFNIRSYKSHEVANLFPESEDMQLLFRAKQELAATLEEVEELAHRAAKLAENEDQIRTQRDRLVDAEAALAKERRERDAPLWTRLLSFSDRHQLKKSGLLDTEWYLAQYPDVAKSGRSPAEHYLEEGYLRGYRPNPLFDTRWYLDRYADVRSAGINPLLHYLHTGSQEGRDPGPEFQTDFYLLTNPNVRMNGMNPLAHYLRYGKGQGRLSMRPADSRCRPQPGTEEPPHDVA
jgi:methyltransferase family protein